MLIKIMARVIINGDFETARKKLNSVGITLTTHQHRKGGYVCYANKTLRESLKRYLELNQLLQDDIHICGKLC